MNLDDLPEKCSDKDLAKYFGKTPATIREWANRGELTHVKFGNSYVFYKTDLIEDIEARKCQRKAAAPISNGARTKALGISTPIRTDVNNAEARLRMTIQRRKRHSQPSSSKAAARTEGTRRQNGR